MLRSTPLRQGMRERDYVEGRNVAFTLRYAPGDPNARVELGTLFSRCAMNALRIASDSDQHSVSRDSEIILTEPRRARGARKSLRIGNVTDSSQASSRYSSALLHTTYALTIPSVVSPRCWTERRRSLRNNQIVTPVPRSPAIAAEVMTFRRAARHHPKSPHDEPRPVARLRHSAIRRERVRSRRCSSALGRITMRPLNRRSFLRA